MRVHLNACTSPCFLNASYIPEGGGEKEISVHISLCRFDKHLIKMFGSDPYHQLGTLRQNILNRHAIEIYFSTAQKSSAMF